MRLADRVVVMKDGLIQQASSAREIYDAPATLFVAEFVGSPGMNRIAGSVSADGRSFAPSGTRSAIPLLAPAAPGPAVLGIRPEHLRVAPHDAGAGDAGARDTPLRGRVVFDEYLGADRCLHLDGPAGRLVVRIAPDGPRAIGSELALQPDPARVRLYDAASGARIL